MITIPDPVVETVARGCPPRAYADGFGEWSAAQYRELFGCTAVIRGGQMMLALANNMVGVVVPASPRTVVDSRTTRAAGARGRPISKTPRRKRSRSGAIPSQSHRESHRRPRDRATTTQRSRARGSRTARTIGQPAARTGELSRT